MHPQPPVNAVHHEAAYDCARNLIASWVKQKRGDVGKHLKKYCVIFCSLKIKSQKICFQTRSDHTTLKKRFGGINTSVIQFMKYS